MPQPVIKMLSNVRTNAYMCNDALLIQVRQGKGALRIREYVDHSRWGYPVIAQAMIGDKVLVEATMEYGTSFDYLTAGYGIEKLDLDELMSVRDKSNAPYGGIEAAAENLRLFFGLLSDGTYLLVDHQAFPSCGRREESSSSNDYFWNADYQYNYLLKDYPLNYFFPAYLFPSESASAFDPKRMEHYLALEPGSYRFPRLISIYLSGGMALIINGHHKAAAAAYTGQNARCLSIMPVKPADGFADAIKNGEKLYLNHNVTGLNYHPVHPEYGLRISMKGDVPVAYAKSFERAVKPSPDKFEYLKPPEKSNIPENFYPHMNSYPTPSHYRDATMIPKSKIRAEYARFLVEYERFFREGKHSYDYKLCSCLRRYYEVFPRGLISEREYRRIVELSDYYKGT